LVRERERESESERERERARERESARARESETARERERERERERHTEAAWAQVLKFRFSVLEWRQRTGAFEHVMSHIHPWSIPKLPNPKP